MSPPRVTLAMIVRDEADMTAGFLETVDGLWQQLVVVDTGSIDGTEQRFAAVGAHVVAHPWADDFSDARNVSLRHATEDWVLVLDADERVTPDFIAAFKEAIADPTIGALSVRISNPLPYGHRRESHVLRAWRNDSAVRFEHAIHEDASNSVARMLARRGLTIGRIDAPIEHLGYVRTRAAAKQKKERDSKLLRACVAKDPFDFYSRLKLLEVARYWRDGVMWKVEAQAATDALEVAGRSALANRPWAAELIALIAEGLFRPDSLAGLAYLNAWAPLVPQGAALFHRRAVCHETLGQLPEAADDFERCLGLRQLTGDEQLSSVRPLLGLARLALTTNAPADALAFSRRALSEAPRDPEALMAVCSLERALGGATALDRFVAEHQAIVEHCPERDWALGEALIATHDYHSAAAHLRLAAGVPPSGPAAVRLAQCHLAAGHLDDAEVLARAVMVGAPEAGLGVLLADLIRGRDTSIDLELTPETAHAALKQWVDALLAARNASWVQRLHANVGAVRSLFPWLESYLARKIA